MIPGWGTKIPPAVEQPRSRARARDTCNGEPACPHKDPTQKNKKRKEKKKDISEGAKSIPGERKKVKSLSSVRLFRSPKDYSLPGSSVHGIFQARILEWVAISFPRGPSRPRD